MRHCIFRSYTFKELYMQYGPNQITNGNKTVGELKNAQKYNYLDMHHTSICNSLNSFHILHSLHSSKV